jgi:phytoene desaturase
MMKFLLDEMFVEAGRRSDDYLEFVRLDPMYDLVFDDFHLRMTSDVERMAAEIEGVFPGQGDGYRQFRTREVTRFQRMYGCLQKDFGSIWTLLRPSLLRALPHLSLGKSIFDVLGGYFEPDELRVCFTFQSKYLGMSPWDCPGFFAMIPFVEHAYGIYHTTGGLSEISRAMARVVEEEGGEIHLGAPVERLIVRDRVVTGVRLEDGREVEADAVVVNADFAHAMTHLVEPGILRKYTPDALRAKEYSCSTFMLYLGLDKTYDMDHHTIIFSGDYRAYLKAVAVDKRLSDDVSFYVRNASVTDPTLAPEGHTAIYVLVPVPNNSSSIDWPSEEERFRDVVIDRMAERTAMTDIREHIRELETISPRQWEEERGVYNGATFNLAHRVRQMLYFRPHNEFEELRNCFLVGGGTHPGSGLPTIYESGRITANLLSRRCGVPFSPPPPLSDELMAIARGQA